MHAIARFCPKMNLKEPLVFSLRLIVVNLDYYCTPKVFCLSGIYFELYFWSNLCFYGRKPHRLKVHHERTSSLKLLLHNTFQTHQTEAKVHTYSSTPAQTLFFEITTIKYLNGSKIFIFINVIYVS